MAGNPIDDERPLDKQQLDQLYGHVLQFAHQTLEKYGEFYPFGAALAREGKIQQAMSYTDSERPPSQKLIELMRAGFRKDRKKYIATAVCYDVRVRSAPDAAPRDAICVALEHEDGLAVDVFEPYTKRGKAIEYGAPFAQAGQRLTFGL